MACGGRPSARARTSAALVERSPKLGSLGTSTAKAGASGTRSSPASMAALSAWRTSPSTWRFIRAPAAPKTAAGMRVRDAGSGHGAPCMRGWPGGATILGARPVLARCAPGGPRPARLPPRARDQPPRGSRRARLVRSRARPPPATPPGARPALGRSAPGALAMTPGSPSPCGGAAAARLGGLLALGRGAPAGRLLRGGFLGLRARALDQLDHRERRRVPVAGAQLDDARVAARAVGEARRDLVEELLHHAAPPDERARAPARVQRPLLAEGDHAIAPAAQLLRLGVGGAHHLVLEQRGHQVAEKRPAVRRRAPELHACHTVAHDLRRLLLVLQAAAVELLARREVLEPHAEREPHLVEELLDLVQRLAAEVLGLEHLLLALLHQLADVLDVRVLEAVGRAHRELEVVDRAVEGLVLRRLAPLAALTHRRRRLLLEVHEDAELLLEDARRLGNRVLRPHAAVGEHLEHQPVVVGALSHACVGDREVHLGDGGEDRVDGDGAHRIALALVAFGRHVPAAHADHQLDVELGVLGEGGAVLVRVQDLDPRARLDLTRGDLSRPLRLDACRLLGRAVVQLDALFLQDMRDVGYVLVTDGAGGVLGQYGLLSRRERWRRCV